MKLYNTLTKKKQEFKPLKDNLVRIYVCGPTVNDVPHLGHARQQISFDILRKYLEFLNYKVKFVSNVTDIEDKIIKKSNEENISIEELTKKNYEAHMKDYEAIGIKKPDIQPFATKHVPDMIDLVKRLEEKGYTYIIENDGVYFNVSKFKDYGKLSHQNLDDLKAGARICSTNKKNPQDFVLWKFSKPSDPPETKWDSPWGKGRPGWHIECSAMSHAILGLPIDIHGGGQDLIFPHHEDEIAQSEAGYEEEFSKFWIHNGMVNVDKVKMSKSLGNFKTIRDLLKNYSGQVIRYLVLSNHYRKPLDFSKSTLENAKNSYESLKNLTKDIKDDGKVNKEYLEQFQEAMDDDLNTSKALQFVWKLVRDKEAKGKYQTLKKIEEIFELKLLEKKELEIPNEVKELAEQREKARKEKDFEKADELRDKISKLGFIINDAKEGYKIDKK